MQVAGEWREIEIDLRGLSSIDELQDEVLPHAPWLCPMFPGYPPP